MAIASHRSKKCDSCPHAEQCKKGALDTLHEHSKVMNVTDYLVNLGEHPAVVGDAAERSYPSKVKINPTDNVVSLYAGLSGRAYYEAKTLSKRGVNLRYCLNKGINPYSQRGSKHMTPLFNQLIVKETFGREHLKQALKEFNSQWSESSISSHVSTALKLFEAQGLIEKKGVIYRVIRNV